MGTSYFLCQHEEGKQLLDFLFASLQLNPSKEGSTLKEKNLLLEEQILFF